MDTREHHPVGEHSIEEEAWEVLKAKPIEIFNWDDVFNVVIEKSLLEEIRPAKFTAVLHPKQIEDLKKGDLDEWTATSLRHAFSTILETKMLTGSSDED